jgi:hypothetical protein
MYICIYLCHGGPLREGGELGCYKNVCKIIYMYEYEILYIVKRPEGLREKEREGR